MTEKEKDFIWFELDRFTTNPEIKEKAYFWIIERLGETETPIINDNVLIQGISHAEGV